MNLPLPHHFDTTGPTSAILRVFALLCAVLGSGVIYLVLVRQDVAGAAGLLVAFSLAAWFARICFRHLSGSVGTISASGISVRPGELLGVKLKSPAGDFKLGQFSAVRVDVVSSTDLAGPVYGRVFMLGGAGAPDIQIASMAQDEARAFGARLAGTLDIQFQERSVPY
jgi:hypothetical protein